MAGATAAILFPTMRELDPVLPAFAAYPDPHWLIAAGEPAAKVFAFSAVVQWVAAGVAIASLGFVMLARVRAGIGLTIGAWGRVAMVLCAAGLVLYQAAVLAPRMDRNMHAYWDAARAGQLESAAEFKRAFDADHPRASRNMSQTFAAVGIAIFITCFSAGCGACATRPEEVAP